MLVTLARSIEDAASVGPHTGFTFVSNEGVPGFSRDTKAHENSYSYQAIERTSARFGGALQALGLRKGDRVALILPQNEDFVFMFFGAIRAGIVPVPVYPPLGMGQLQGYLDNTRHIVQKSGAKALVTTAQIKRLLGTVQESCPELEQIVAIEGLRDSGEALRPERIAMSDVAFLQFTSGSTSRPKGVTLTHENVAANVRCIMHDGLRSGPSDVGVSWLPLFHDMGLIGFVIAPLVYRVSSVFVPSLLFLKRPVTWFQAMTRHRGSIAYAPNFAYALAVKRIRERELEGIDLSSWRVAGCGAEPIRAETLETFASTFAKVGFRKQALLPSYGMAESSLAVSFTELEEGLKTLCIDGERLWAEGRAHAVPADSPGAVPIVSCGAGFPEHRFAIFGFADPAAAGRTEQDDAATPLPEAHVGEIRIQGPSVMRGYWEDAEETQAAFAGEWLCTGDLGFVYGGHLFVCGRIKEVVIVNGRNYYPQDIEWEASKVPGVRKGNVIAFGTSGGDRERVIVAFELQTDGNAGGDVVTARGAEVALLVRKAVQDGMALTLDDAVPLAPGTLPKTSSGKLQRAFSRSLYEAGDLAHRKSAREHDRIELLKEAAKSQFSFFKRAFLGKTPRKDDSGG